MKRENAAGVIVLVLSIAAVSFAGVPDQPYMQAARTDLQKARAALKRAEHNKGGHRATAIGLINSAIVEVNLGINFDQRFIRRRNHANSIVRDISPGVVSTAVDQPNMRAALDHLQNAKRNLQSATADKGGHRKNAIDLVNQAIAEVNRGIAAGK